MLPNSLCYKIASHANGAGRPASQLMPMLAQPDSASQVKLPGPASQKVGASQIQPARSSQPANQLNPASHQVIVHAKFGLRLNRAVANVSEASTHRCLLKVTFRVFAFLLKSSKYLTQISRKILMHQSMGLFSRKFSVRISSFP